MRAGLTRAKKKPKVANRLARINQMLADFARTARQFVISVIIILHMPAPARAKAIYRSRFDRALDPRAPQTYRRACQSARNARTRGSFDDPFTEGSFSNLSRRSGACITGDGIYRDLTALRC